MGRMKWL